MPTIGWILLASFAIMFMLGCVSNPPNVACTQELKLCPDGTGVGRTAPFCEFAPCPDTPIGCTKELKICSDGSGVGRVPPACEFTPCPVSPPNPAIQLPPNYVASESTIPISANQKFEELSQNEGYRNTFGSRVFFCRKENEGFYLVDASAGFFGIQYYFSITGENLGSYGWDDIAEPNDPLPPFSASEYPCTLIKESPGKISQQ